MFKPRKYRVFDYTPRYYSATKEKIELASQRDPAKKQSMQSAHHIRSSFASYRRDSKVLKGPNYRVILIALILVFLFFYLFDFKLADFL